jgi:alpha-mannosidase
VVFNPLGWARSGDISVKIQFPKATPENVIVTDVSSHKIIFESGEPLLHDVNGVAKISLHVEDIPAFGYKLLNVAQEKTSDSFTISDTGFESQFDKLSLKNKSLRISVNTSTGCITSIYDIQSSFETLVPGACGNELQAFKDTPKDYDAWNIDPGTLEQQPTLLHETIAVNQDWDHGAPIIQVRRRWQQSDFVQTISLNGDQVDIDNEIDWHESHVLLKAAFPLAASGPFATYEIPYGTIDRPTTRNNSWEKAQFEVTALRWADLSGPGPDGKVHGLSILNQNKYGYDAAGNVLRLTLLRSPKWPDAEADMGHHHFHYALYPHAGTWKDALTVRHGYEYNYPLTAVVTTAHPGALPPSHSFASVTPENVVLTAVKKAEDANGLIFRVYEWAGKETTAEFHVPPGATGAIVTNLMETPEGAPLTVTGDVVKAPIHPYEILTIRVDYPNAGPKP